MKNAVSISFTRFRPGLCSTFATWYWWWRSRWFLLIQRLHPYESDSRWMSTPFRHAPVKWCDTITRRRLRRHWRPYCGHADIELMAIHRLLRRADKIHLAICMPFEQRDICRYFLRRGGWSPSRAERWLLRHWRINLGIGEWPAWSA